ncbi:MAG: leucine-rich repeat domain-containing protein [Candidatus Limivivens sp.]|nr:leucine-rich repeat domain-containing protein [Candidatus Limivivens sp.]
MRCLYEDTGKGIRLLRCFSPDSTAELPEKIDGEAVTELAPYFFSDHFEAEKGKGVQWKLWNMQTGECGKADGEELRARDNALCGERLKEAILPKSLVKIGRYAFYNCSGLEELSFGEALKDIGAGAFTGCHHVKRLSVTTGSTGISCLREILAELPEKIRVEYRKNEEMGVFWFPEYFEEGVENTPARILENHVHGSGMRYRNCFQNKALDIREYDSLFESAKAWEDAETVTDLALGRMLHPLGLTEAAQARYLAFLQQTLDEACRYLIKKKDGGSLAFVLKQTECTAEMLDGWLDLAAKLEYTEGVTRLMEERRLRVRPKKRSFSL